MEPAQGTLTFDALFYSEPCEVDIWEPLKPTLGVEVRFHYVAGFRHGTRLLRWRPDKTP